MTNQEAFDKVWHHFVVEQNPKSWDEKGICKYRGPNGTKCAAGIFISDEVYDPIIEGNQITYLKEMAIGFKNNQSFNAPILEKIIASFEGIDLYFLRRLQIIHDENFVNFEFEMRRLAQEQYLKIPGES